MNNTAIRARVKDYALFSYGGKEIKFRATRSLKRYLRINKWNAEGLAAIEKPGLAYHGDRMEIVR